MTAPVVLFVYNRPDHTLKTLDALQSNVDADKYELIVCADGPKSDANDETLRRVKETRKLFERKLRFRKITLDFSDKNQGCSKSIYGGISRVLSTYKDAIIVEDDIHTSPYFLKYCNQALEYYKDREEVMTVSAYSYPIRQEMKKTYFLSTGAAWGWGTWARAWKHYNADTNRLLAELETRKLKSKFNFNDSCDFCKMLEDQRDGKIDTWDVQWYASIFLRNGLTLYPAKSLTINFGQDGSGTHYTNSISSHRILEQVLSMSEHVENYIYPEKFEENAEARKSVEDYFRSISATGRIQRFRNVLKKLIS